jgi:hypothetical protein
MNAWLSLGWTSQRMERNTIDKYKGPLAGVIRMKMQEKDRIYEADKSQYIKAQIQAIESIDRSIKNKVDELNMDIIADAAKVSNSGFAIISDRSGLMQKFNSWPSTVAKLVDHVSEAEIRAVLGKTLADGTKTTAMISNTSFLTKKSVKGDVHSFDTAYRDPNNADRREPRVYVPGYGQLKSLRLGSFHNYVQLVALPDSTNIRAYISRYGELIESTKQALVRVRQKKIDAKQEFQESIDQLREQHKRELIAKLETFKGKLTAAHDAQIQLQQTALDSMISTLVDFKQTKGMIENFEEALQEMEQLQADERNLMESNDVYNIYSDDIYGEKIAEMRALAAEHQAAQSMSVRVPKKESKRSKKDKL